MLKKQPCISAAFFQNLLGTYDARFHKKVREVASLAMYDARSHKKRKRSGIIGDG
jgi:hypothetical protein